MPLMVVPGGYTATQRRPIGVDIDGGAYDELNMIGVGYVIEQSTETAPAAGDGRPGDVSLCSHRARGAVRKPRSLQPRLRSRSPTKSAGSRTILPFSLETTSAATLEEMMNAKTLTSKQLVKAELYRIALTNADGPAIQAIRNINPDAHRGSGRKRPASARKKQESAARPAGGHPGGRRRLDQRLGSADERRLDRAGGHDAREPTRRSSPS